MGHRNASQRNQKAHGEPGVSQGHEKNWRVRFLPWIFILQNEYG